MIYEYYHIIGMPYAGLSNIISQIFISILTEGLDQMMMTPSQPASYPQLSQDLAQFEALSVSSNKYVNISFINLIFYYLTTLCSL